MILGIAAVISGFVLGSIRGGSARTLLELRARSVIWLALGLFTVAATQLEVGVGGGAVLAAGLLALVVAAARNRHLPGAGVVAVGLGTNAVSVLLNGSTPVDPRALDAAGVTVFDPTPTQHLAGAESVLPVLGSAIPVPLVGLVASFGDLILATGLVVLVAGATLGRTSVASPTTTTTTSRTRTPIPVAEILDAGPLRIVSGDDPLVDLTSQPPTIVPSGRVVRTGRTSPDDTVDIPLGWEAPDPD